MALRLCHPSGPQAAGRYAAGTMTGALTAEGDNKCSDQASNGKHAADNWPGRGTLRGKHIFTHRILHHAITSPSSW
ncbi:hypothetical protein GCM10009077_11520 [Roseibium denhamense]